MWKPNVHTKTSLETRIGEIKCWLKHHYPAHYLYQSKKQAMAYYSQKLGEMEELKINQIHA